MSEIDKHAEAYDKMHIVLDFLDWCEREEKIELAVRHGSRLLPITASRSYLLFKHYGIDEAKLENERRALIRKCNEMLNPSGDIQERHDT